MTGGQPRRGVAARLRTVGAAHRPADARAVQPRLRRCRRLGHPCQPGRAPPAISPTASANSAAALAGFSEEIGPAAWRDTVVVVISEFGRTFRENGDRGTDHGHGSVYWVMGGGINGGRIAGEQVKVEQATPVPEPRLSGADRLPRAVRRPVPAHVRAGICEPSANLRRRVSRGTGPGLGCGAGRARSKLSNDAWDRYDAAWPLPRIIRPP